MKNYRKLIIRQKPHTLAVCLHKKPSRFPETERFNLTGQCRSVATSIRANVAEGWGRYTRSDFANFLQISLGSLNEGEYLTLLFHESGSLKEGAYKNLDPRVNEGRAMLISLITKVRNRK